jgi:Zn-dependent protease
MLLIAHKTQNYGAVMTSAVSFFSYFATLNVWFAVFNFIPVPPLDGSRIVNYFLPPRLSYYYSYVERYGFIILIVLLNADRFIGVSILRGPMQYVASLIITGMHLILTPIFNLFI